MSGGLRHHNDEETGRAMRLDTNHPKQDQYSHGGNQCVCADGKGVRETARSRSKSSLTRPTSLEMLKTLFFKIRKNEIASGCVISDLLRSQDIFYPPYFGRLGRKASFSTPTPHYTHPMREDVKRKHFSTLSVRPRSVLASRPLLLRGEDFGFNAWSATEYDRDTDRSCWSPVSGFMQRFRHQSLRSCASQPLA